tara:strand:+ start:2145 stop:2327 length:183 start_codon:yes stop_codon:yes gene_type:complete
VLAAAQAAQKRDANHALTHQLLAAAQAAQKSCSCCFCGGAVLAAAQAAQKVHKRKSGGTN